MRPSIIGELYTAADWLRRYAKKEFARESRRFSKQTVSGRYFGADESARPRLDDAASRLEYVVNIAGALTAEAQRLTTLDAIANPAGYGATGAACPTPADSGALPT